MAIDPYIARGGVNVGGDVPNILAMIDQRNQQKRQNALQDQQIQKQSRAEEAKQTLAETQWALAQPDPHQAVASLPHIVSALQKQGIDVSNVPPDQLKTQLQNWQMKAASELGQGPPQETFGAAQPIQYQGQNALAQIGSGGTVRPIQGAAPYEKPTEAGSTPPVAVVGPSGKGQYVDRKDAIGKEPYSVIGTLGAGGGLTEQGIDIAAQGYLLTGQMPSGLTRIPGANLRVINRSAELAAANGDDAKAAVLNRQAVSAGKAALSKVTTQKALVGAFEKTALKNMDLAAQLSSQLSRTSSPILNRGLNAFRRGVTGDPETAQFTNALVAARTEYAKVLSGATGASGITDAARKEADELFGTATSNEALQAVLQTARQEMHNRMSSFDEQISEINASTAGIGTQPQAKQQPQTSAAPAASDVQALLDKYK